MDNSGQPTWSWCLHCERAFLSARAIGHAETGDFGEGECPFLDCDGSGYEMDLYFQRKHYRDGDGMRPECWPTLVEPVEGVIYPLYKRDKDEYAEQNSGKSLEFKPGYELP